MLSIVFGYNGSTLLLPYLASGACHYSTLEIRTTEVRKEDDLSMVEEFLEKKDPTRYIGLISHLRVPNMDGDMDILNRIAYTSVGLEFTNPPKKYRWMYLRHTMASLQRLRSEYPEIPSYLLDYVEKNIWKHLGAMRYPLSRAIEKMILHITLKNAEKIYNPNYIWKTGPHQGKKTMNILLERSGLPSIA